MQKCAPRYPQGTIKKMPQVTYRYWQKEAHISEVLPKILKEIAEKFIKNNTQEETF